MPIKKDPLTANCLYCRKGLLIKFVAARKAYSQKNDWDYWTEEPTRAGEKICDNCLVTLYRSFRGDFREIIKQPKKRVMIARYIKNGVIKFQPTTNIFTSNQTKEKYDLATSLLLEH
jgi:hypothetical protein